MVVSLLLSNTENTWDQVAVEIDTFLNEFDPNYIHIGVDTNSIMSDAKADISRFERGLNQHQSLQIKLEYDGWQSNLQIFAALLGEPLTSILNHTLQLRDILPQSAYIGFTASTGRTDFESHRLLSWTFTSFPLPVKASSPSLHSKSIRRIVWLASIAASVGTLVVGIVALVVAKMARGSDSVRRDDMETRSRSAINAPRMFTYKQLVVATDNFNHKNLLGVGGFGSVYKGHAPGPIAVKKISAGSKQGEREFLAEICTIGRLRHKNVVQLNGWCHEKGQLLLVYEFMPNGSLDKFISKGLLPWDVRHRILSGLASALLYLHEECGTVVVHRDLKPNNVMLDEDFNAHLGDFGLARLVQEGSITTMVAGTPGYLAPECSYTGRATTESDVFGFGIVVLEVVCGRRLSELNLVDYIWGYYGQGQLLEAADVEPRDEFDQQQVMRALVVGLACAHPDPAQRPRMRGVVQVFMNSNEPLMELPTSRPAAIYIPVRQSTSKLSNGSGSNSALSVPPLSFNDITTLDCGR
ncbi:L-type lectin-domain containing receptor kinase IX.1 [Amborella trichopoda]|uniref:non-specific serine/threonine protein kinase n=1 Tax=Amborella trichopoda TaxID=13333 RepID=W1NT12_AMBTC|nr:L-type lectin-domain containing receptor kinase IX.1 [Amborella trichopoda]ERN00337.1 hypothetical protein AMTR_s00104p00047250 [Amborella trichopoda]|eukprot:XP_006837768.1 L-type lectin-domain containing receptor kinase IX.1 [Amborella trichopoda]